MTDIDIEFKTHVRKVASTLQERHGNGPARDAIELLVAYAEDACLGRRGFGAPRIGYTLGRVVTDPVEEETVIALLTAMEYACRGVMATARFFLAQAATRMGLPPEHLDYEYSLLVYIFNSGAYVVGHGHSFEESLRRLVAQYGPPLRIARSSLQQQFVPRMPREQEQV